MCRGVNRASTSAAEIRIAVFCDDGATEAALRGWDWLM